MARAKKLDYRLKQQRSFSRGGSGGYFSYEMITNSEDELSLLVRYWGAEWGGRKFAIFIDNEKRFE